MHLQTKRPTSAVHHQQSNLTAIAAPSLPPPPQHPPPRINVHPKSLPARARSLSTRPEPAALHGKRNDAQEIASRSKKKNKKRGSVKSPLPLPPPPPLRPSPSLSPLPRLRHESEQVLRPQQLGRVKSGCSEAREQEALCPRWRHFGSGRRRWKGSRRRLGGGFAGEWGVKMLGAGQKIPARKNLGDDERQLVKRWGRAPASIDSLIKVGEGR